MSNDVFLVFPTRISFSSCIFYGRMEGLGGTVEWTYNELAAAAKLHGKPLSPPPEPTTTLSSKKRKN